MAKTIGIDLGTTNSVVAYKDTTIRVIRGADNEELCRSCVAMDKEGNFVVGNQPYMNWPKYAPNIVVSAKRLMGGSIMDSAVQRMKANRASYPYGIKQLTGGTEDSVAIVLKGKEYTPEQISAEILKKLKEDTVAKIGEVDGAVITVPAYFSEKQKAATRRAAELAGLNVQRILAEPTAAALSYGADKMAPGETKIFLVYDFGGGTFDLSIIVASDGKFVESGAGGDRWLGGDDIDRILIEYVYSETEKECGVSIKDLLDNLPERKQSAFIGKLKSEVESAKKALSSSTQTTVSAYDYLETEEGDPVDVDVTITRVKFESLIRPTVQKTIDLVDALLEETNFPIESIDNILLVGGSSCIPLVRKMLSEKYGEDKILFSEKPMLAIAEGAAVLSQSLSDTYECPKCGASMPKGSAVCPSCHYKLGETEVVEQSDGDIYVTAKKNYYIEIESADGTRKMERIIDKGELLPFEKNRKFSTVVDNQKVVEVKLFNEDENGNYEHQSSGFFTLSDDLPKNSELFFKFNLSIDEVMDVSVRIVALDKTQGVILGRGQLDSQCLATLHDAISKVQRDGSVGDDEKGAFFKVIQGIIDTINSQERDPMDQDWPSIASSIMVAQANCKSKEKDSVYLRISEVLCKVFGHLIDPDDKARMEQICETHEKNHGDCDLASLERLCNSYNLLIEVFMYNILANNTDDPRVANKAGSLFASMMDDLNANDVAAVKEAVSANASFLHQNLGQGGNTVDWGTGIH